MDYTLFTAAIVFLTSGMPIATINMQNIIGFEGCYSNILPAETI
jgi:hypothetical protein